jgi:acetyl esterase/lipase
MTRAKLTLITLALSLSCGSAALAGEALDIQYTRHAGVDPALNRLDVYSPDTGRDLPVIVFVHGGGWKGGDKSNLRIASSWLEQVKRRQHVLVGVNFRLWTPQVSYREQVTDIAAALRWVNDRISRYRGSNKKVFLLGHSSGAHLVSLLGTDPAYLMAQGLPLSFLRGVIPFDVPAYDIPLAIQSAPALGWPEAVRNLSEIFTRSFQTQQHASPVTHLRRSRAHPPFHVVYAPTKDGLSQRLTPELSAHFVSALQSVGARAGLWGYANESHSSLATDFGDPQDQVTRDTEAFIDGVLARMRPRPFARS